jgi:S-formylglutathione hydrolase FrmB
VLRRLGNTPPYFGGSVDFAKRDPVQLVRSKSCSFALWIDIGNEDPWATNALQFDAELSQLGVHHEWHLWSGGHSDAYWKAHLADYLGFYARAFARKPARTTLS